MRWGNTMSVRTSILAIASKPLCEDRLPTAAVSIYVNLPIRPGDWDIHIAIISVNRVDCHHLPSLAWLSYQALRDLAMELPPGE